MNVIYPRLHMGVAYVGATQMLWKNIRKRYVVANIPKIHKLKTEIASCKQQQEVGVLFKTNGALERVG